MKRSTFLDTLRPRCLVALALALPLLATPMTARGQDHADHDHHHGLHFSHPLVTESPSPDTKLRVDYSLSAGEMVDLHTFRLEAEYAFAPGLSIEADIPFTSLEPDAGERLSRLDNIEVGLKYANSSLAEHGLLLGGGVAFGLPTGNDELGIGSSHVVEVEPYADFGYMRDRLEVVGFLSAGLPQNVGNEDEADVELGWNLSILYHATAAIEALVEVNGDRVYGGEEDGFSPAYLSPGIKLRPKAGTGLQVGAALSIPVTDAREFDSRPIVSAFYHF